MHNRFKNEQKGDEMSKTQVKMCISCKKCAHLDVNWETEETYCLVYEEREIFLKKSQKCPKWCPLKKKEENVNV